MVDLLLTDADIVTMAAHAAGPVKSLLVRDDRIVAAGPAEPVRAAAAPGARVVRLDGAAVIPGLIDAHCHLCNVGYLASGADCSQPAAPDIPAIVARLRDAVARGSVTSPILPRSPHRRCWRPRRGGGSAGGAAPRVVCRRASRPCACASLTGRPSGSARWALSICPVR